MSLPSVLMPQRLVIALACLFAIVLAACGPGATPTPTSAPPTDEPEEVETVEPTDAPEEVETEEATEVEADETEVEASTEEADGEPTDEPDAEGTAEAEGDDTEEDDGGDAAASGEGFPATVSVSSTRVREAPNSDAPVIVELPQGTAVTVTGRTANSSYAYIVTEDGTEGWVAMQTLRLANLFANPPVMTPEG